jgi:L-ascorbate metabolism protein UlaG (beta-lactamase superfamily)
MNGERWYKKGKALRDEIGETKTAPGTAGLWFMGQHGFVIKLNALVFCIDVILNALPDKEGNDRRAYPPPFESGEFTGVDYFLCTHGHSDHLNLKTLLPLAKANPETRFVVPMPLRTVLTGAGIAEDRVLGARAGEALNLGGDNQNSTVTVHPIAANHPDYGCDINGDYLYLGYVLKGEGISVYHAGDTWASTRLAETLKGLGPISIALLPVNGTDWERTSRNIIGNMNIQDAVKLAKTISADLTVPTHYDMMPNNSENPAAFADCKYRLCPEKKFHIFSPGERFIYRAEL